MIGKTPIVTNGACHYGRKCCPPYATKRQQKHAAKRAEKNDWKKDLR